MNVMAISSSPRGGGQSKTEIMLAALVKGMRETGATVQEVFLRNHTVHYCTGCYTCWTRTPGVCQLKDDMTRKLFPMYLESDLVVYASPLYHFTMNACMKAFIERTLPMVQPFLVDKGGRTSHPLRTKPPASVMLSVAGFPEISVFQHLSSTCASCSARASWARSTARRPSSYPTRPSSVRWRKSSMQPPSRPGIDRDLGHQA
jgi:NAD(P)H-dependent FMN reductase